MIKNNLFVITGGPGVGKTSLLHALAADGYSTVPEVARTIIRQQAGIHGDALPWKNSQRYTDLMLTASIEDYKQAKGLHEESICFFDRGVLDAVCYAKMIGYALSSDVRKEVEMCRYNPKVFILPPWQEIYGRDSERKQTWEEAKLTYTIMKRTYAHFGYHLIDVPINTVDERKEFVLAHISESC